MTSPFGCFACSGADHWESNCPELTPVKTKAAHEERIAKYIRWWNEEFRITAFQKQKLIEREVARWKPERTSK